jgi:hypothetical protein
MKEDFLGIIDYYEGTFNDNRIEFNGLQEFRKLKENTIYSGTFWLKEAYLITGLYSDLVSFQKRLNEIGYYLENNNLNFNENKLIVDIFKMSAGGLDNITVNPVLGKPQF